MTRSPNAAELRSKATAYRAKAAVTQVDKDAIKRIILREGDRWGMLDAAQQDYLRRALDADEVARQIDASERIRRSA